MIQAIQVLRFHLLELEKVSIIERNRSVALTIVTLNVFSFCTSSTAVTAANCLLFCGAYVGPPDPTLYADCSADSPVVLDEITEISITFGRAYGANLTDRRSASRPTYSRLIG